MKLPPELDFLSVYFLDPEIEYRSASWLISDFESDTWTISFDQKTQREISWNVVLDDGSLLTSSKNRNLLKGLKYYLTTSTRDHYGRLTETNSQVAQARLFYRTCHIIDLLLVNSGRFKLSTYSLEGLTEGNLIEILEIISSSAKLEEKIYNWNTRLRNYCLQLLEQTNPNAILEALASKPQLSVITNEQSDDDALEIPLKLIPKVRAALHLNNIYHKQVKNGLQPNTMLLSKELYKDTLWGKHQLKPVSPILCYNENLSLVTREYPAVPVKGNSDGAMQDHTYKLYRSALYNIGILHEINIPAPPIEALIRAEQFTPLLPPVGRFRSLPSAIVFSALRQAIEFHIEYGEELTRAFCRIAIECKKRNISPSSLTSEEVCALAGDKLLKFGVNRLSLSTRLVSSCIHGAQVKGDTTQYFKNLRANSGILELIAIYIGSVQLTTGILMARRASELYSLPAHGCLDLSETYLIFKNAKSTRYLFGYRREEARPIEPIAADMIKTLIKMQKTLKRVGYIADLQTLFATPSLQGAKTLTNSSRYLFDRNLDLFCDYFETPKNPDGARYYLRQHQIRRFFAMLFFYCGSFAKLDTLQWMLGHTDPTHVYRYITESTDGSVLAGAKAHYIAEQLHQGNIDNYIALADFLKDKYGTDNFSLIDTNDLEDQIHDLMREGWLEIEPEFFTDHEGTKFKVVARFIRSKEVA
ncbi:TPA: integrase [Pseudomonas aeruginosa]|nr:integrase [Pseudomonas aeruginosa]